MSIDLLNIRQGSVPSAIHNSFLSLTFPPYISFKKLLKSLEISDKKCIKNQTVDSL